MLFELKQGTREVGFDYCNTNVDFFDHDKGRIVPNQCISTK